MLGLHHGFMFSIAPMAPWIVALKRYLYEGKQKGQLAVAGTIIGQAVFFAMTYFGWVDVVHIWYLLEPALFMASVLMFMRIALDMWQRISFIDLSYGPVKTRREGANFFLASFFLMFCNPWEVGGTQYVFMTSIPENVVLYLAGFTLMATLSVLGLWATVGNRIFGKAGPKARIYGFYTGRRLAVMLATMTTLTVLNTSSGQFIHPYTDSVAMYLPERFDRFKIPIMRGYVLLKGENPEENKAAEYEKVETAQARSGKETFSGDELREENRRKEAKRAVEEPDEDVTEEDSYHINTVQNFNQRQPWTDVAQNKLYQENFWYNPRKRLEKLNQSRDRFIFGDDDYRDELYYHVWKGPHARAMRVRNHWHTILPQPKYERVETPEYFRQLAQIRHEIDQNLRFLVPPGVRTNYLPYSVDLKGSPYINELDLKFRDKDFVQKMYSRAMDQYELAKIKTNVNKLFKSIVWEIDEQGNRVKPVGSYEQMNMGVRGVEISYVKLHELPTKFRAPWEYTTVPLIKPSEEFPREQVFKLSKEELEARDKEIYKQLTFLNNEPERIPPNGIYRKIPWGVHTDFRLPFPTSKEDLQTRRDVHARNMEEGAERKETLSKSLPDVDVVKPKSSAEQM